MKSYHKALSAEFLGTFALVFVGAGAVVVEHHTGMSHPGLDTGKVGLLGIALGSCRSNWSNTRLRTTLLAGKLLFESSQATLAQ